MTRMSDTYLVIPDLQIPFEHENALDFCAQLKRHYRVRDENVLCVGDETDQYFGGLYKRSPDATHTPTSEIAESLKKLQAWYKAFPKCKVAISNHGLRWARKAFDAEIPSQVIRPYRDIINAPQGWVWKDEWVIQGGRTPFRMIHGMGYSGQKGHRFAAIDAGISTLIGHLHSHAGIDYITTHALSIWAMNTGCLIDCEAYAFQYGKYSRYKPVLGAGLIFEGGSIPFFVPLVS